VERCGRGAGAGPGQVRSSPASLSPLSSLARSLSVCVLPVGSSLLPRLPDSFLQWIPYPFSGNRRVKRTNKQFPYSLNLLLGVTSFCCIFFGRPLLLLLLRFFLRNWMQQIERAPFSLLSSSPSSALLTLFIH